MNHLQIVANVDIEKRKKKTENPELYRRSAQLGHPIEDWDIWLIDECYDKKGKFVSRTIMLTAFRGLDDVFQDGIVKKTKEYIIRKGPLCCPTSTLFYFTEAYGRKIGVLT